MIKLKDSPEGYLNKFNKPKTICNICHKNITDKQEYSIFFDGKKDVIGHIKCIKELKIELRSWKNRNYFWTIEKC